MNDWLTVYKHYRMLQGSVIKAREIVVSLMMRDDRLEKVDAQDLLMRLINEDVKAEILVANNQITERMRFIL